ncbi:MAG: hypothetical protein FLDDKLPJ_01149 [Phycisphaerae bacterium]|nr:hypothetical protein [Phycisphaerae bacterium]
MKFELTPLGRIFVRAVTGLMIVAALPGCSEKPPEPDILSLSGKVVDLDVRKGLISVEYENEKRKTKATDTARVTDATEIHINGVLGKLSDVKIGCHVRGDVLVEGKGPQRQPVVLRIYVETGPAPSP